jgi:hypothetical protein
MNKPRDELAIATPGKSSRQAAAEVSKSREELAEMQGWKIQ